MKAEIIDLEYGKYYIYKWPDGTMKAERYREEWSIARDWDSIMVCMFDRIKELEGNIESLQVERKAYIKGDSFYHY